MFRKILHIDLDAFFCSVEEKLDPSLRGKPFATGGSPDGRGVVTSCSYAARRFGIHSAMPMQQALRRYPELIIVRGHFREYALQSKEVMKIIKDLTPLVEQISIDEAFLDVTDLPHESSRIAADLQTRIFSELTLPCSIGAATNKLVAKIANNIGKKSRAGNLAPMAITVIEHGREAEFLGPLPVEEMWGIGPKSAHELNEMGINKIGDILDYPCDLLVKKFGSFAREITERARGFDESPVAEYLDVKSMSNEVTFFENKGDQKELYTVLRRLSEKVGRRMREKNLCGRTIKIKLRWPNFETHTHQITLKQPTNQDSVIFEAARNLFNQKWRTGMKVRLVGLGVSQLAEEIFQLELFDRSFQKENELLRAIDQLHERFGEKSIQKGIKSGSIKSWKD